MVSRVWLCAAILSWLLAAPITPAANAQGPLRWKFEQGDRFAMVFKLESSLRAPERAPNDLLSQTLCEVYATWEVLEVDESGTATIEHTLDRVKIEMGMAFVGALQFDTAGDSEGSGGFNAPSSEEMQAAVGQKAQFVISARGEIESVSFPEGAYENLAPVSAMGFTFGNDFQLLETLQLGLVSLPEEAVAESQTWNRERTIYTVPLAIEYTYRGEAEEGEDGSLIESLATLRPEDVLEWFTQEFTEDEIKQLASEEVSGTIRFDEQAGYMLENQWSLQFLHTKPRSNGSEYQEDMRAAMHMTLTLLEDE